MRALADMRLVPPVDPAHLHAMLTLLPDRAVLEIGGADRIAFLQGLVSNDVTLAAPDRAVWAALLSPQGKWLADFFILAEPDRVLLDLEAAQADMVATRLRRYRLCAQVTIEATTWRVHAGWNDAPAARPDAVTAADPRLPQAGWRSLSPLAQVTDADPADWDLHRLALGLPDGSRDLESDKSLLLEAGFDELCGVSWTKGCYMGQELTARTKYRGLIKRRLLPVRIDGALPAPGTPIEKDGREIGTMRSGREDRGLATIRLDAVDAPSRCGDAIVNVAVPAWMRLFAT